jgi:homocysteine S-methyltransferase
MRKPFKELLKTDKVLICDGAMGTLLYARGAQIGHNLSELNISNPQLIQRIHQEYVFAGASIIETNTFDANYFKLSAHGIEDKLYEINFKAGKIAREAVGEDIYVAGSVGPLGKLLEPFGKISETEAEKMFSMQISALKDGGIDLLILETMVDLREMKIALATAKKIVDIPIINQFTFTEENITPAGDSPETCVEEVEKLGGDVVGANCGVGPENTLNVIKRIVAASNIPVSAQPNAGFPRLEKGKMVYFASPAYFAAQAKRFVDLGVQIVGGCCGTTPEHIKAVVEIVETVGPLKVKPRIPKKLPITQIPRIPKTAPRASYFVRKLKEGFAITVEVEPPKDIDYHTVLKSAQLLKESGADAVNITDNPLARLRMSSIALAHLIKEKVGIDVVLHFTCRDKNLLGLQSELLGAYALGVENILALTGDPTTIGDYPHATSVFDVDSEGLIKIIKNLNSGQDLAGHNIGISTCFFTGIAGNPSSKEPDKDMERLSTKVKIGADFIITQPVYDIGTLKNYVKRIEKIKIPVVIGILPLASYRHAEFLHNEVPGITIPDEIRERMKQCEGEDSWKEGVAISKEFLKDAKHLVSGAYITPPHRRYDIAVEIVKFIRSI